MIGIPESDSSTNDSTSPNSRCTRSERDFKVLPTMEISQPAIGIKIRTNKVSLALIANIKINAETMVIGSRISISRTDKKELCTSFTSEVIRARVSPFLFSE